MTLRRRTYVGLVSVVVFTSLGCDVLPEFVRGEREGAEQAPAVPPAPRYTVELATVARADLEARLSFVGTLEGLVQVDIVPNVAGRLQAVHVQLGDQVRLGQPVAQIRTDDLETQVRQAEHAYDVAQATVRQREVDLTLAETTRDRAQQLFQRGLIAREELDDAETQFAAHVAQVELAQAQFAQNGARLDELRIVLEDATIRSPVDGFVATRDLDPGAYASTTTPVVTVVDIHRVKLVAQIVERDFRRVRLGASTQISVDAYPQEWFDGVVARVAPVLDPVTRTADVEIEIPNADFRLKPGMYARVDVEADRRRLALIVPRNALVDVGPIAGVFRVRRTPAGDVATFVPVQVGLRDAERVEITAGVSEGQEVITTGASGLTDGDVVTVLRPFLKEETS